ncbi:MAG: undecaprenyldiphospho-muramoylpentapeptide beta-N-acetylglucosaminyltransferase, partial [Magnetococcales bacterium]|nr:undecaprenyldiphospho-muramoylpentapeptide beta-N-acetylglucosaminyltransferase [Magnetococcales bacterium]
TMTPTNKRLLIAGGGTGGHLFPAVALADLWEAGGGETLFVGASGGMECRILPELGKRLITLKVGRIKGGGAMAKIHTVLGLPVAFVGALRAVRDFAPHAVLGMGGYASAPSVVAARLLGIPTLLHEQNAIPGLTNRWLGRLANRVLTGFAQATTFFPQGVAVETGNPVRKEFPVPFPSLVPPKTSEPLRLLIFGGSQGARIFTEVVPHALIELHQQGLRFHVRQQARPEDLASVQTLYEQAGIPSETATFFKDMATAYQDAHLVISRAGASSVAELAAVARPSLLIPYEFAADDHQTANAIPLTHAGGAWTQTQKEFNVSWLVEFLRQRYQDPESLVIAGENARTLARPHAATTMMVEILQLLRTTKD